MWDVLAFWVWFGGLLAFEDRAIGFWKRVLWPLWLGERLAAWAWGPEE